MARGEQIDKLSKKYVKLHPAHKKFAKKQHKRYMRRLCKLIDKPHPKYNRYHGWIG